MENACEGDSLPLAPTDREETAKRVFGGWEKMSAEEWAARFSHTVGCSSFDQYRYRDPSLHAWIHRLHDLFRSPGQIDRCRKRYLTPEEIEAIKDREF